MTDAKCAVHAQCGLTSSSLEATHASSYRFFFSASSAGDKTAFWASSTVLEAPPRFRDAFPPVAANAVRLIRRPLRPFTLPVPFPLPFFLPASPYDAGEALAEWKYHPGERWGSFITRSAMGMSGNRMVLILGLNAGSRPALSFTSSSLI